MLVLGLGLEGLVLITSLLETLYYYSEICTAPVALLTFKICDGRLRER